MSALAPGARAFLDTNIILYAIGEDAAKADAAEELLSAKPVISVQVLHEAASVLARKLGRPWAEIRPILETVRALCDVVPVTEDVHVRAVEIAEAHRLHIYDAAILAAAWIADIPIVYSEDMQDGFVLDERLTVRNPFLM